MTGLKRDVIYDLDASLSSKFDNVARTSATIVYGWNHIANYNQNTCPLATNKAAWDNAIMCDQSVSIKRVVFTNLVNAQLFKDQFIKTAELTRITDRI